jgi:hypothetical protein
VISISERYEIRSRLSSDTAILCTVSGETPRPGHS